MLDEYTSECLAIRSARSIPSRGVIQPLEWLFLVHGTPAHFRSDSDPGFVSQRMRKWLEQRRWDTMSTSSQLFINLHNVLTEYAESHPMSGELMALKCAISGRITVIQVILKEET